MKRMPKFGNQPFEQTFRLQVNLPHNQRMVLRVSPRMSLAELKLQICNEKELQYESHSLVHPAHPDAALDLNGTLGSYGCTEISIISNSAHDNSCTSNSCNLMICSRNDDEKKKRGILRLFSRKKKEIPCDVSYGHIVPPEKTEDSHENNQSKHSFKRKPAPAPPVSVQVSSPIEIQSSGSVPFPPESVTKLDELRSTISHSRHSSDSSGYHEPSVFSDCSENKSPEIPIAHCDNMLSDNYNSFCKAISNDLGSKKLPNFSASFRTAPTSGISNNTITRKRKAPLPPSSIIYDPETPSPDENPMTNILVIAEVTADGSEACKSEIEIPSEELKCWASDQNEDIVCSENSTMLMKKVEVIADEDANSFLELAEQETAGFQDSSALGDPEVNGHEDSIPQKEQATISCHSDFKISEDTASKSSSELPIVEDNLKFSASPVHLPDLIEKSPHSGVLPLLDEIEPTQEKSDSESTSSAVFSMANVDDDARTSVKEPASPTQQKLVSFSDYISVENNVENVPSNCESDIIEAADTCHDSAVVTVKKESPNAVDCVDSNTSIQINNVKTRKKPDVKIVPFLDKNLLELDSGIEIGNVQRRRNELIDISIFPLTGRSTSLYSLSKDFTKEACNTSLCTSEPSIDSLKEQKNVSEGKNVEKLKFKISSEQFHDEYSKLQAKFFSWQKQLENNQSLLQNEVIPEISRLEVNEDDCSDIPDALQKSVVEPVKNIPTLLPKFKPLSPEADVQPLSSCLEKEKIIIQPISREEMLANESETSTKASCPFNKSQTLPRLSNQVLKPLKNSQTMTLNRKTQHKSHAVSVSIGSWMQRNESVADIDSASVASSRSKFQSLENIPVENKTLSSSCYGSKTCISGIPVAHKSLTQKSKPSTSSFHGLAKVSEKKHNEIRENTNVTMKDTRHFAGKNEKRQTDSDSVKVSKSTKPFVRISSMKDEMPPPLHTLKKWPFPEINENSLNLEKRTAQEVTKATTIWSSLEPREVVRAEVDLRKHRTGKPQILTTNIIASNENSSENGIDLPNLHVKKQTGGLDKFEKYPNEVPPLSNVNSISVLKKVSAKVAEEASKEPTYEEAGDDSNLSRSDKAHSFVNGSYLPPPPPPVSTMPAIPPAAAIPKSSQLIRDNNKKQAVARKSQKSIFQPEKDPREELMLEIRGFGGRQALRKVISPSSSWHMKVHGTVATVNL